MNGGGELFWVGFENCLTDLLLQIPNRNMWGEWAEMDRTGLGGNERFIGEDPGKYHGHVGVPEDLWAPRGQLSRGL